MNEVVLRRPTQKDLAGLFALWKEQTDFHYELDPAYYTPSAPDEDKQFEAYFTKALDTHDPYFFVAEVEGILVGFITYKKGHANYFDTAIQEYGWVMEVFVHHEYRNHGIGTKLMEEAAKFFKAEGLQYVKVEVSTRNTNAMQFYKNNGFFTHVEVMYKKIT
jgi:diamine N-acetyltransferase